MEWLKEGNELIPLSWFKDMREQAPLSYDAEHNSWDAFRYEDIKAIFTNHEHFSSQLNDTAEVPIDASILFLDPPKHRQLRMLVSRAFTPQVIEGLAPKITAISHELCDQIEQRGRMDVLHDFASPLPMIVIAEMLGIPASDRLQFREWSNALVGTSYDAFIQCQQEMSEYFTAIANGRRAAPQQDLISSLVHTHVDGEQLTDLEIIGFCVLLLVAGNETTTNLISSAMLCFDSEPSAREQLAADPSLFPTAIEEVLRYCSPVQKMSRRVKQATELCGQSLEPGQQVDIWIGSANHDPAVFESPNTFNIHRSPNPHLAFGHGIHFCLGAQLARLEARIALRILFERFANFRRDQSHMLERAESSMIFGLKSLPFFIA
ncbi:cytochrome P450 [Paenibacillus guangzhouensis]|uniref:cytochrome P450 n=1 Tax=Paenibacillus guangzhouensis TaxID=1473112 RepID=UPI0012677453|nr:cytochrome P450 [Paenibacillus guangzhouensis]